MKKLCFIVLFVFMHSGFAASAAQALQKKLNAIRTMKANFKQVVRTDERVVSRSSGSMALSRPGRFRWDTKEPMAQLVIADGKKMWVYDVELEQVTVKKQKKSLNGTAALFLSGYDDTVARDYRVSMTKKNGLQRFDMQSKEPEKGFQRVKMTFDGKVLKRMDLYDQLGQVTQVSLSQVKLNPSLAKKLFQFTPPEDVDVVRQFKQ